MEFTRDNCVCTGQGSHRVKENLNIRISNLLNVIVYLKIGAPEMVHYVFAAVKFYKEQLVVYLGMGAPEMLCSIFCC